jgi:hypothetical protein
MGSLPSTLLQAGASQTGQAVPEPEVWMVLLLAAGLGAVAGMLLASVQALALRPHVLRAWLWLPANALAWAIGMPTIFLAIDLAQRAGRGPLVVVVMAFGLVAAGAAVGAVHGWILVRLELKSAARGRP